MQQANLTNNNKSRDLTSLSNLLILHLLLRGQSPSTSELLGSQIERSERAKKETLTQRDSQTQHN
jgi:hypothetical protein